jgi:hypothetical protein
MVKQTQPFWKPAGTAKLCSTHFDNNQITNIEQIVRTRETDPIVAKKMRFTPVAHAYPNPSLCLPPTSRVSHDFA